MTDHAITVMHRDTVLAVAEALRNLSPETCAALSSLLPLSGMPGVIEALARSIEKLPAEMDRRRGQVAQ